MHKVVGKINNDPYEAHCLLHLYLYFNLCFYFIYFIFLQSSTCAAILFNKTMYVCMYILDLVLSYLNHSVAR